MIEGTQEFGPTTGGGAEAIAENRIRMAKQSDPIATMPPTPELPLERLPLIDRLGARLAFERMGVRLYDALISKHDAYGSFRGGPSRADLEAIRNEEQRHLELAHRLITQLGGDPTVVTPNANLQAVASRGIGDILVDPRSTLIECLEAIIVAELADHESWEMLASSMGQIGDRTAEQQVRDAERIEAEHLAKVRTWLTAASKLGTD
jgi:rubrerythrin